MKVIYVGGPFRARPDVHNQWIQWENVRRAATLALEVWKLGAACLSPHLNTAFFEGAAPADVWLRGDLELLDRCDAMLVTPDWEQSEGTKAEVAYANTQSIPVLFTLEEVEAFLRPKSVPGPDGYSLG